MVPETDLRRHHAEFPLESPDADEEKRGIQILFDNNYPPKIIDEQLHRLSNRMTAASPQTTPTNEEPVVRRAITYSGQLYNSMANAIQRRSNKHMQILAKPSICLQQTVFTKLKTPIDTMERTNIVYEIPCDGNNNEKCDLNYVGLTKNPLKKRLTQHRRDLRSSKPAGQSAVVTHFEEKGHIPAFDRACVLGTESYFSRRNTLESLHICSRPTYNLRRDTDGIAASYVALLERQQRSSRNRSTHTAIPRDSSHST